MSQAIALTIVNPKAFPLSVPLLPNWAINCLTPEIASCPGEHGSWWSAQSRAPFNLMKMRKSRYWLILRETPHRLLWVDSARSRACSEQSITLELIWAYLSAISFLLWPGEGTQSPTLERWENGPDSDKSLMIASLVKFRKVSLTKHHTMQRSLGEVVCSLPWHLSGWIMSLRRDPGFLSLGTCEYNIIWK